MAPSDRQRVQRAIARSGVASRRAAERLVADGRVEVNGVVARIGQTVGAGDRITVDGAALPAAETVVYLLNKAAGTISTTSDPQGRPTVLDGLPGEVRVYPVGRLDRETTGALLLTNDGALAERLMHPRNGVIKEYEALLDGAVTDATIARLRSGVDIGDVVTRPARVGRLGRSSARGTWLELAIGEGRNRQIRRMAEAVGHRVLALHRPRYAGLELGALAPGRWRRLSAAEVDRLGGGTDGG